ENETPSSATTPPKRRVTWSRSRRANSLGAALDEVEQPSEDALAIRPQAVVLVLVRHPGAQAPNRGCGLLRELARDVHVLRVDRSCDRNLVLREPVDVVERRPLVLGEDLRRLGERLERAVLLEHPRIDVLAREEGRVFAQVVREDA